MSFPVFGQILGLVLIFSTAYFYNKNIGKLLIKYPNLEDTKLLLILSLVIILPGLIIYLKALWEYLVAYGAINSMLNNMLKSGRVYDFEAHTNLVKNRRFVFAGLWFLIGLIFTIALLPPFWIIGGVMGVYFVLSFQVFTFEEDKSAIGCLRKSLILVHKHFASTFLLITFSAILTYLFVPQLLIKILDIIGINAILSNCIKPVFINIPLLQIPAFGVITDAEFAKIILQSTIAQAIIQYTLPLRSILWSLWYKELSKVKSDSIGKSNKRTKRLSEKLMKESHKKYGKSNS